MLHVDRGKEMDSVPDERPAESGAVLGLCEIRGLLIRCVFADQVLVLQEAERRSVKLVGPGLGDGVDQTSGEATLAHVVGRDQHLVFAHRFHRNWVHVGLTPGDAARGQPEEIVIHAPVDLNVVEAIVLPPERRPRHPRRDHLRDRHDEIGEIAAQGWEAVDDRVRNDTLRSGARA